MPARKNRPANITNLKDLLDTHAEYVLSQLNCIAIGTVVLFTPATQVVQCTINYRKYVGGKWISYPAIVDAPAVILTGGLATLTMPITPGDTCVLLFNDRPFSSWFKTGLVGPLPSFRMHSMSDGIALVGIRSLVSAIKTYDMLHAMLSWGPTQVGVSPTQVRIANIATTLGKLMTAAPLDPQAPLGGLITALETFCTSCAGSSDATLVSAAAALKLALNTPATGIAALMAGLLE